MTTGPPPFPPSGSPPPVPEGWNAQWSGEHRAWFYFNQASQTSTWQNPLSGAPLPPAFPPPYVGVSGPPAPTSNDNEADEKSETDRGFSPLHHLGRVFGHHHHDHHQNPTPLINQDTRLSTTTQLYIHSACFGDQDVTQKVRSMVTAQHTLSLRSDSMTYHFGDPWPNHRKQFALLYSYGTQPWQLIACMEGHETINLHPLHPVDRARTEFVQNSGGEIVAAVWGVGNALEDSRSSMGRSKGAKLMEMEREGRCEASNAWMGFDGNPNVEKMAVVFYREADGRVGVVTAREGETLRLPWNSFAGAI